MAGFDWDQVVASGIRAVSSLSFQFSTGVWFVTQKFSTKSSCLTYQFKTDELGFKSIEQVCKIAFTCILCSTCYILQVRQLPYSERVGLDHEYM